MEGSNINGIELLVTKGLEGVLPRSPHPEYFDYEHYSFLGLKLLLSSQQSPIIFDIGASYGVMSCLISKMLGGKGRVYAFEANSSVIEKAEGFAKANNLRNIDFINKFVGEKSGLMTDFFIVPGTHSVASTRNPEILKFHPQAVQSNMEMLAIDDFVQETGIIPELCKVDIEGAEYVAITGMQNLLTNHQVDLVIETHGDEILGIGGDLNALLRWLQKIGYVTMDLVTRTIIDIEDFVKNYNNVIGHILLSKKLKNQDFARSLLKQATDEIISIDPILNTTIDNIQTSIEHKNFGKTAQVKELLKRLPDHPRLNYLYALSLQLQQKDTKKSLHHYNLALSNGFDEYWVKYNRCMLLADLGDIDAALADAERLQSLKPTEQEAMTILNRIRGLAQKQTKRPASPANRATPESSGK